MKMPKGKKEKTYRVSWEIDVTANSHKEAAKKALEIQRNPESIATVFKVEQYPLCHFTQIDLQ